MRWIVVGALVVTLAGATYAIAAPRAPQGGERCAPARWREALRLSDQQVAALERAQALHRERAAPLRIEAARARLDLREAMLLDQPDQARVDAAVARLDRTRSALLRGAVALRLEVTRILTREQQMQAERMLRRCVRARARR